LLSDFLSDRPQQSVRIRPVRCPRFYFLESSAVHLQVRTGRPTVGLLPSSPGAIPELGAYVHLCSRRRGFAFRDGSMNSIRVAIHYRVRLPTSLLDVANTRGRLCSSVL